MPIRAMKRELETHETNHQISWPAKGADACHLIARSAFNTLMNQSILCCLKYDRCLKVMPFAVDPASLLSF
jgi:hypothetical protein